MNNSSYFEQNEENYADPCWIINIENVSYLDKVDVNTKIGS